MGDDGLLEQINELFLLAAQFDARSIKKKLQEIVPEYQPEETQSVV